MVKLTVDKTLMRAKSHKRKGEIEQARALYKSVLDAFPNNVRARKALAELDRSKETKSSTHNPPQDQINALTALYNQGQFVEAAKQAEALVGQYPGSIVLWNILGASSARIGCNVQAIAAFQHALAIKPDFAEAHNNMGNVWKDQGKLDEAITAFQHALAIKPDFAEAHINLGSALQNQGKLDEAITAYQRALAIKPNFAKAHSNLGSALQNQDKLDEAITAFQRALAIKPDFAETYNNLGNALQNQDKLDEAITAYQRALSIKPDFAEVHNNLGNVRRDQGKLDEAITAYQRALAIKPDFAEAYGNIGSALQDQGKLDEAITAYQRALAIKPDFAGAESQMLHQRQHICDWREYDRPASDFERLGVTTKAVPPFSMLSIEDNSERQMLRSQNFSREIYKQVPRPLPVKPNARPERLRIGYFSADFKTHPMSYLLVRMLELHDRSSFEIHAFSFSKSDRSQIQNRIIAAVDEFHDVRDLSDPDIYSMARESGIDIAIDLMGHTKETRLGLFSQRIAPVQITFLGFPGTTGADFMDYIIADDVLIPEEFQSFYTEKIIRLPDTYLPTDNTSEISEVTITKSQFGLPEDGFVFCCFNNNYKISPQEFDIWMRLLDKIDGSVLWLAKSNKWAEQNLRKEAVARGIDPSRLVLTEKLPHYEHLARHKCADLFIDTFNYNAHTTASEALWVGLPVVTKIGNQFAARVAASLLNAVGLPELITETETDYEALILKLARNPDILATVKEKLDANRLTLPLFDTNRYTRNFENGLEQAYDRYFEGRPPEDIWVD